LKYLEVDLCLVFEGCLLLNTWEGDQDWGLFDEGLMNLFGGIWDKSLIGVRFDFDELVLICTKNVNEFVLICFGICSSGFA